MKKLLQSAIWVLCFLLIHFHAQAQGQVVTGVVTSADDGTTLPGVSVLVRGTSQGVSTDLDGKYAIEVSPGEVLRFSFVGMLSQEITVRDGRTINVTLGADEKALDEVVVIGYGTQKRSNVTGAVTTVDTEVLASRPITDVARGLQGTTPGLTITTPSGQIGQNPNIRLRGMTGTLSNTQGAQPLILVDNVEIESLQLVNPEDIESISVLKDAAASSIYGSRAAWGVILITTKSGIKGGKPRVSYSNNFAWNTPTYTPEIAPAAEGAEMAFRALQRSNPATNVFSAVGMAFDQVGIQKMREWEAQYGGQDLGPEMVMGRDFEIRDGRLFFYRSWDPAELFLRQYTPQQKHDVSVSGGTEKTNYYLGAGYLGQEGVLKTNPDQFDRYNLNFSISTSVTDWMEVRAKVLYSETKFTRPFYYSPETYDPWYYIFRWQAVYPYGTYEGLPFRNSINEVEQSHMNEENTSMSRINLGTTLRPVKGLSINLDYTYSNNNQNLHQTGGILSAYNFWATGANLEYAPYSSPIYNKAQYNSLWSKRNVGRAFATYDIDVRDHAFKVMVGSDIESFELWTHGSERRNLMDPNRGELSLATGDMFVTGNRDQWATLGFFSRFNYIYSDKLLLEVNGRYDGSSRLSPTERWGFFPSMSAGYILTEEPFMEPLSNVLSFMKLRGSYGAIGNQNAFIGDIYRIMNTSNANWMIGNENMRTTTTPGALPSALTWETVSTLDFGVDARFFRDKFGMSFDWFRRTTSDMHSAGVVLPSSFGTMATKQNLGELQTTGWELAVDYSHQFTNGLRINSSVMLSDFKEVITDFADNRGVNQNRPGRVLGEIWGFETDGFFTADDFVRDANGEFVLDNGRYVLMDGVPSQAFFESGFFFYGPGDIKYKDLNGDGVIDRGTNTVDDPGDMRVIGNTTPRYQYGIRLGGEFKGFDLSFFVQGVGKREMWANGPLFIPGFRPGEAWYTHQLDYWTEDNPNAFYPRPTDHGQSNNMRNFLPQTKYLLDLSYMRMKNITVGYTIPSSLTSRIKVDRLRVYFSGENLFEFDNVNLPIDPETEYTTAGLNDPASFGRIYPFQRTLSFGVQFTL
ncbi:SusC/RagA family TonB-linked outer membrane protein [Anditalea andensis]|uniref:TonB-dependent receptor n=1 Tax=Anditalea andensis TaxID=1048983 RepID=A0A074L4U9_9BACT|nr:TonB-dependent receptor [Anditalea andensis]KEO75510.1 TonB-dependent receptor [Anditalea andensis]